MKRTMLIFLALVGLVIAIAAAPLVEYGDLSAEGLMLILGGLMSAIFSYFPGLNTWYAAKPEDTKKIIMAVLLLVLAGSLYAGTCFGIVTIANIDCTTSALIQMVYFYVLAVAGNQGIFKLSIRPQKVLKARVD